MFQTAVFSVIFPGNLPYFKDFLESLVKQTSQDFELILLVDGVPGIEKHINQFRDQLKIFLYETSGSLSSIRSAGIKILIDRGYQKIIFSDTDDRLQHDRIKICTEYLEDYPLVTNDISLIDKDANLISDGFWSSRLANETQFDRDGISNYNFIGLGNTSIRGSLLKTLPIPDSILAIDWYLFYHLLGSQKGIFLKQGKVDYRHQSNFTSINTFSMDSLLKTLDVKIAHYSALVNQFHSFAGRLQKQLDLRERAKADIAFLKNSVDQLNASTINYFWWEETEYI